MGPLGSQRPCWQGRMITGSARRGSRDAVTSCCPVPPCEHWARLPAKLKDSTSGKGFQNEDEIQQHNR
ncbi:unnamed protein product [Lota lota]